MGRLFTRLVIILKDEPPGPIIIPAPNEVNGVDLLDSVFSTSYLERRCLEIFILSFGNIPPIYIILSYAYALTTIRLVLYSIPLSPLSFPILSYRYIL